MYLVSHFSTLWIPVIPIGGVCGYVFVCMFLYDVSNKVARVV